MLKSQKLYQSLGKCVVCGAQATDLDEAFITKQQVRGMPDGVARQIYHPYNCAPLCNTCNCNITREMREKERLWILMNTGRKALGDYAELAGDREILDAGIEVTQAWIDRTFRFKVPYRVRAAIP